MDRGMHIENGMSSGFLCDVRLLVIAEPDSASVTARSTHTSRDGLSQRVDHMTGSREDPGSFLRFGQCATRNGKQMWSRRGRKREGNGNLPSNRAPGLLSSVHSKESEQKRKSIRTLR